MSTLNNISKLSSVRATQVSDNRANGVVGSDDCSYVPQTAVDTLSVEKSTGQRAEGRSLNLLEGKQANLFEDLPRADSSDANPSLLSTSGEKQTNEMQLSVEAEAELAAHVLALLSERLNSGLSRRARTIKYTLPGFMLGLFESQEAAVAEVGVDRAAIEPAAEKVTEWASTGKMPADVHAFMGSLFSQEFSAKVDVNALVQMVLRESYLMQSEDLKHFAEKVKFHNAQKKAIREHLKDAREIQAKWHELAQGDENFVSSHPVPAYELGDDGKWRVPPAPAGEQGIAGSVDGAWDAALDATAAANSELAQSPIEGFLAGEGGVSGEEFRDLMAEVRKGGGNIKDNLDLFISNIPQLNIEQFFKLVPELLGHLTRGNMDEEEYLDIFEAMSPEQYFVFELARSGHLEAAVMGAKDNVEDYALGFDNVGVGSETQMVAGSAAVAGGVAHGTLVSTAFLGGLGASSGVLTILGPAGAVLAGALMIADAVDSLWDGLSNDQKEELHEIKMEKLDALPPELTSGAASPYRGGLAVMASNLGVYLAGRAKARIDQQVEQAAADVESATGAESTATKASDGEELHSSDGAFEGKAIRTTQEMDAHLSYLEDKLQSIGDDAQLANVDLQNALQRQQQTLQMMSNISKMLHDTASSVIRNMS